MYAPVNQAQNQQMQNQQMQRQQTQNPDIAFEPLSANANTTSPAAMSVQQLAAADVTAALAELAQDERNGAAFYAYLAEMASNEWDRDLLLELSENSLTRSENAATLTRESGGACEIHDVSVTENIRYGDGVAIAVRQESRLIDGLAALMEKAGETRGIQVLLARKISDYGKLQLLR